MCRTTRVTVQIFLQKRGILGNKNEKFCEKGIEIRVFSVARRGGSVSCDLQPISMREEKF